MDHQADATDTTVTEAAMEQTLPVSSHPCQTESGGSILLQLLEFKTHLLEAVEELHIRRDAESRFEDQISELVLEKQELEWEKESLQHQIETAVKQHTESLASVQKQFQAKVKNMAEEKGKYQVSAELKDKEINNLKEELRSLQLLKYNLEKKSSELEQKLRLQSRMKESQLTQLEEAERRFSGLSRQCALVQQAHDMLEQSVDEAMRINEKVTSANKRQEATIVSLRKEIEDVNKQLIKAKLLSVTYDWSHRHTGREQDIQTLQHKLSLETEMNKTLMEENVVVRAEKQEVMRSLQRAQQLLLSQTQAANRAELELQAHRERCQALKQEHQVMRDKGKAARLMESHAACRTSWDKEREELLDGWIRREKRESQAVKDAQQQLRQKHTQAQIQQQHIRQLKSLLGVSAPCEPVSSSSVEDTGAVTTLAAAGASRGREASSHCQRDENNRSQGEDGNKEQQLDGEEDQGEDVKEETGAVSREAADRREESQGSGEDAEDTRNPVTETRGRAEGHGTDREEETAHASQTQILVQTERGHAQKVTGFMDTEPLLDVCEPSDSQRVSDQPDGSKACGTGNEGKALRHHSLNNKPNLVCQAQGLPPEDAGPSSHHGPEDKSTNTKQTDELGHGHASAESLSARTSAEPQPNEKMSNQETNGGDDATVKHECGSSVKPEENYNHQTTTQEPKENPTLKDVCADIMVDSVDVSSEAESGRCHDNVTKNHAEDAGDAKMRGSEKSSDPVSVVSQFVQDSEQSMSGRDGHLRHRPNSTSPIMKHSTVPAVITSVSDLLNTSSVSGNAASFMRHPQGDWKSPGETSKETRAAEDRESRASLSITSPAVSTLSGLSWPTAPRCSRAAGSAAGPESESQWEDSSSQKREEQQASFRAQISKMEQFLSTERLRLSKRQRTDN